MIRTVVFAFLTLSTLAFHAAAQNSGKAAEICGVALVEPGKKPTGIADLTKALQMDPSLRTDYEPHLKAALRK